MRDYELEVLEQYDMEVKSTRKIRGAFFCDTCEGTMILKETKISERRAALMYIILSRLELEAGMNVDTPVFSRDGVLVVTSREGRKYMLKKWFSGRECDLKRESELVGAAETLAGLHRELRWDAPPGCDGVTCPAAQRTPVEEMQRHNREMKKVRSFIRNRVTKNEFEYLYLENFEKMYGLAERVTRQMEESGGMELFRRSLQEKHMVHGDYNYHNLMVMPDGAAVTNFEHVRMDIQVSDLCYFLRKVMEKCHWKQKLGREILEAYEEGRHIDELERDYIGLWLAYPEKFWKTASSYARSNKAWLPEKSVEKLQTAVQQSEEKEAFLESLFSINLRKQI